MQDLSRFPAAQDLVNETFFACLWTEPKSRSINTQKKNEANIQPSWPNEQQMLFKGLSRILLPRMMSHKSIWEAKPAMASLIVLIMKTHIIIFCWVIKALKKLSLKTQRIWHCTFQLLNA